MFNESSISSHVMFVVELHVNSSLVKLSSSERLYDCMLKIRYLLLLLLPDRGDYFSDL